VSNERGEGPEGTTIDAVAPERCGWGGYLIAGKVPEVELLEGSGSLGAQAFEGR
jgi:hypothetical protein